MPDQPLSDEVVAALRQPLDPALVATRKGGAGLTLSYLEGHTVIDEANAIFGFGGWGFELLGEPAFHHYGESENQRGEQVLIAGYTAVVRVTVVGAPVRTDVGFSPLHGAKADHHDMAIKGAVTDGLKRALRSFGDRFGNGLYGQPPAPSARPPARTTVRVAAATPAAPADNAERSGLVAEVRARFTAMALTSERVATTLQARFGKSMVSELTLDELRELVARLDAKAPAANDDGPEQPTEEGDDGQG